MAKLVSKTYGDALFELAVETDSLDMIMEEAQAVSEAFSDNAELLKILTHPKITPQEKITIVENIFKGRVSETMLGFLVTVGNKNRYTELENILAYFLNRVKEYKKIGVVSVTSATAMTEEQKAQLEAKLLDRVVDSSIRTKLTNMAKELSKIQLSK